MKTSYKTKDDFAQVVEALTTVADSTVHGTIKTIAHLQELDIAITGAQLPYYTTHLHCAKSGAFISSIPVSELTQLLQIHGEADATALLQLRADKNIASHWLRTDDQALEKLCQHDPIGYFVYAATMIAKVFTFHAPLYKINNRDDKFYSETAWKVHCQKADLHTALQDYPIEDIITGNELMRRFLSIFDSTRVINDVQFTAQSMQDIGEDLHLWNDEVKSNLKALLAKALKQGKIKQHLDISDIANLKIAYHGYSNFRKQGQIHGFTESDMLIAQLSSFMPDHVNNATERPWAQRAKLNTSTRIKPQRATKGLKFNLTAKKKLPSLMDIAAYREKKRQTKD